ncbi:S66 peptidase family protein [Methylobacterium radiotolerans]|uniref:Peptidase U61 LD-carboxypeptidase A n=1 Tax=Methylobacterium radiotolerans (strain ATCC 27329 / DSM 1819 / JCM 2831 / NBRC 15690 / NCIMB 10815 / 0-1) TaxID=426355 RepID=B1MA24_METRJ|nr:LD-carboxypeptidase [Methylobacterium radiotolerans]ACB28320.1 peptidase U61 LD-carboxypeptidase A [Methylobacterium radiotolerans JCM 2831]
MPLLRSGDLVRFVSPASCVSPQAVERRMDVVRSWGLLVEVSPNAFKKFSYLAGTDDERFSDLSNALLDPSVRAVFATRGGKGSYRILHRLPFGLIGRDPKPVIGFSDITALHLALWRECSAIGVHGALTGDDEDCLSEIAAKALRSALMEDSPLSIQSDRMLPSAALTTSGSSTGPLIGGNLDMIATTAGWALPSLRGAILLIESAGLAIGQLDRALTMLGRAGHLDGLVGIAVGHVKGTPPNPPLDAIDLLRQHLSGFAVPILGGLPIGHDGDARSVLIGARAELDADSGTLVQRP